MKKSICLSIFCLVIGIFSCTTKEGDIVSFEVGTGGLIVNSSVFNARVFIDYRDTRQETPARIDNIPEGVHIVHLFLGGHRIFPDSITVEIKDGQETIIYFDLTETTSVGDLQVSTTPEGALVSLDNLPFGRTPLTVTGLLIGEHSVRIIKGGHSTVEQSIQIDANQRTEIRNNLSLEQQLILVEHFSNTDCLPCPEADEIVETVLLERGPNLTSVISYHPDFPGRHDPFFLAAEQENLARYDYYGRPPLPFLIVDGVNRMAGTSNLEDRFRDALSDRTGNNPVATLDFWELLEFTQESGLISGKVQIEVLEDLPSTDVVMHIALIERKVSFPIAPGSNGQKHFFDVMRALQASPDGFPVHLAKDESEFFDFHFEQRADWPGDLQVVAFLQDNADGEVLQSTWSTRY